MRKILLVLTIVPLLWTVGSSAAVAQVKSEGQLPTQQQLSRLGLERVWWAHAVMNPSRDKIQHVVTDEDIIYVQVSSGITTAFDAETGRQKWAVQIGRFDQSSLPAVSNDDLALIVSGTTMYAIEKNSGRTAWMLQLSGLPSSSPTVDDKQVYYGTQDGSVYAYSLRKIHKLYEQRRLPEWSEDAIVWKFKTSNEITSPPIVTGRAVNFANRGGLLYSVSAINRKLFYQLETNKPIVAPLARMDDTMFMASEDNSFYAINLTSGQVEWEFTSGLPIRKTIWAIDHDLFLLPDRGGIYCLNPQSGERRWTLPNISNVVSVVGSMLAAMDSDGNLVMISRDKGRVVGSLPMRRFGVRVGNDRTDRIYLATEGGVIVCLRQIGHVDPIYHRFPDRQPQLPEFAPDEEDNPTSTSADETEAK